MQHQSLSEAFVIGSFHVLHTDSRPVHSRLNSSMPALRHRKVSDLLRMWEERIHKQVGEGCPFKILARRSTSMLGPTSPSFLSF